MSEPTSTAVECPICGEGFDPTAAGGWCTNPECGEWQYLGDEVPDPDESADEALEDAEDSDDTATEQADAAATASSADDESVGEAEAEDADDVFDAVDDPTTEEEDPGAEDDDAADEEPIAFTAKPGETSEETDTDDALEGAELEFGEPEEEEETAADDSGGESPAEADLVFESAVDLEESDDADIDAVCPDCGASIDVTDNFCPECGSDLHESATESCPDCGAEVDPEDAFCSACGADLEGDSTPDRLALRARGEEVLVDADQTVGREIRRLVTDTGGDEDEAVRIHREHVRFVREDGQFYVVDLGDNPTEVNGRKLSKGDREPIGPGDELALSDVITLSVAEP
ncbi:MAG: zinc-ribbon domain-containing protein [Salinirussus sp.]